MEESDYKVKIFSHDEVNHFRIINLLYRIAPSAVRVKFDKELHPSVLENTLKTNRCKIMEPLRKKKVINKTQWDLLYPQSGAVSSTTFDLTLMICLLRNLASIPVGDILPHSADTGEAAALSRIKYYRNHFAHDGYSLTDADFELYWNDISQAIQRLGGSKFERNCSDMKLFKLTDTSKEILIQLTNSEKTASTPNVLQKLNAERVEVWREEEQKVVKTRAFSCIEKFLKTNNIILAVGSSGCGKSTAIHHAALQLYNLEGYEIVPVHTPGKIIRYCDQNSKQVFVIDDVCGKSTIDIELVNKWTRWSADIQKIVKDYKVKILLSCRTHIYRDRSFKNLEVLTKSSCDLESEYRLSKEERNQIASKYLTTNEVNALQQMGIMGKFSFFPLLCRMYSGFAEGEFIKSYDFFSNPITVIRDDLELLRNAPDQTTFATLTLFVAYNNSIHEELLSKKSGIKQVLEDISDYFHMQAHFSIQVVKSELDKLMLSYVKNTEKTFRILHEKIYDIFLSFCGEHFVDLVLEVAHKDVIRDRFVLESIQNQNQTKDKNVIKISEIKEQNYFERILKDIQKGSIKDIFLNRQFKYLTFRNKLFQYLQLEVDLKKELLDVSSEDLSNILLSMTRQCYWDMVPILLTEHVDVNVRDWKGTPLYFASEKGNIDIAKLLLDFKADPNIKGSLETASQTPLHVAVDNCNIDLVNLLLDSHADANIERNYIGTESPLHLAIKRNNDSIVEALLDRKADCNLYDQWNRTPLYETVSQGNSNLTTLLLNYGADPNIGEKDNSNTPLHVAFEKGNNELIQILIDYKADLNIKNVLGEIPLFQAVEKNHFDIVKIHLNHKSDLKVCNNKKESLLFKASRMGHTKIVKLLLENNCVKHKCDPNICNDMKISPLFAASENGHTDIVRILLENNCDPNICNKNKESPVLIASSKGWYDVVSLLLENKCDPNNCNDHNVSPLFAASENGHIGIVRLLLEHSCDTNTCKSNSKPYVHTASSDEQADIVRLLFEHKCDPNICMICSDTNISPVFAAFKNGHIDIVRLFLQHKCDPNICIICTFMKISALRAAFANGCLDIVEILLERQNYPNICNVKNISPLFPVSQNDHTDIVRFLLKLNNRSTVFLDSTKEHTNSVKLFLERNCDLNFCNTSNKSALFIAANKRHTKIVKLLLKQKCDPNIFNDRRESPLFIAAQENYIEIVKLLLEHKCDPNICNDRRESPLFIAAKENNIEIVKLLLEHKCDPNMYNDRWESPLFIAAQENYIEIVKLLLEHKFDPNISNDRWESPLFIASKENNIEIVKLLLEHKCDPNIYNGRRVSPLFVAFEENHIEIVKLLLEHKCDPNICNDRWESPLFIAAKENNIEIVKLLLEYKCDPDIYNDIWNSPLCIAAKENHIEIVKLLLEHKCDPNIYSYRWGSPLFIAAQENNIEIVKLLLEHKCDPNIYNDRRESPLCIASKENHIEIVKLLLEHN